MKSQSMVFSHKEYDCKFTFNFSSGIAFQHCSCLLCTDCSYLDARSMFL